jgi:streptogramin lyase
MVDGGPNRRWLSFDPKYERFTAYSLPATRSGNATGNTMRVHPDNTVWLAAIASNQIIRLDPATKEFTIYDVPVGVKNKKNATPYGMAVGGDGNIWVVENAFDRRLPEVAVPVATFTGWALRADGLDGCDAAGQKIAFARTKAERLAAGDPRPSLEERYADHGAYVSAVTRAAQALKAERFLLEEDVAAATASAQAARVP